MHARLLPHLGSTAAPTALLAAAQKPDPGSCGRWRLVRDQMWAESCGAEEAGNSGMLGEGGENVAGALGFCYRRRLRICSGTMQVFFWWRVVSADLRNQVPTHIPHFNFRKLMQFTTASICDLLHVALSEASTSSHMTAITIQNQAERRNNC